MNEQEEYVGFLNRLADIIDQLDEMGHNHMGLLKEKEAAKFHKISEQFVKFFDSLDPGRYEVTNQ